MYMNNYNRLEDFCMGSIISEFHEEVKDVQDKTYEKIVSFLLKVEKKLIVVRSFVLLHKPYFDDTSFERCRKCVNAHSRGLKLAFEMNESGR